MDFAWQPVFSQVEVIKKAYMQGEIEVEEPQEGEDGEEEHSASPRNVGHNIYILAHQVSHRVDLKWPYRHVARSQWILCGLTITANDTWRYSHLLFFCPQAVHGSLTQSIENI